MKKPRGFAAMSLEKRREIASKGGEAVPKHKRAFSLNTDLASAAAKLKSRSVLSANVKSSPADVK